METLPPEILLKIYSKLKQINVCKHNSNCPLCIVIKPYYMMKFICHRLFNIFNVVENILSEKNKYNLLYKKKQNLDIVHFIF